MTKQISSFLRLDNCLERKARPEGTRLLTEDASATEPALSVEVMASFSWGNENAIIKAIRTVADRVSTFASDEALCLALVLDLNPELIIVAKNRLNSWDQLERAHPEYFQSPQAKQERKKLEN